MTQPDTIEPTTKGEMNAPPVQPGPITRLARVIGQAARFPGDAYGLGSGEKAALARMDSQSMRAHQIAALSRALIQAELEPENWNPETWKRWAFIAHGMALAGHDGKGALGEQLCRADVAENRVTKLLTARGDAFYQLLPQLLRLLASKDTAPNWNELGGLVLAQDRDEERAESIRMKIAERYFSEVARSGNQ